MRSGREYGITVLRVTLGVVFVMHGYFAGFVYTPAGVAGFNASMGIPLPTVTAWFVILGHFLGGASLVLGYYTRIGAFVHVVIMGGAVFFVHLGQGFFLQGIIVDAAAGKAIAGGYEYDLVLFLGCGPLGLDRPKR
jgi:putative oxidoreductase